MFTAGVDVHVFEGLDVPAADALTASLLELTHTVEDMPFPTIAAVHGLCLTAGLELALACDLLWATESARFGLVEKVVGITPLMGGTQRMAERAGTARAREFVFSGDLYDAPTLHGWGVVNRVLADDAMLDDARAFAARAGGRPDASRTPPPRRSCGRRPTTARAARTSARRRSPHTCSRLRIRVRRCRVSCSTARERPLSPVSEYSHLQSEPKGPADGRLPRREAQGDPGAPEGAQAAGRGVHATRGGRARTVRCRQQRHVNRSSSRAAARRPAQAPQQRRLAAPAGAAVRAAAARAPCRRSSW